ncbi:MAG: ATP-binding protein, partial [Elusimicrobiota bacterium]
MRQKEFAARVWSKLIAFEREHKLLPPGRRLLVAVSGGPDSVCLAHFLAQMARRKELTLELLHVHHGLRGRAAAQAGVHVQQLERQQLAPRHQSEKFREADRVRPAPDRDEQA